MTRESSPHVPVTAAIPSSVEPFVGDVIATKGVTPEEAMLMLTCASPTLPDTSSAVTFSVYAPADFRPKSNSQV